MILCFSYFVAFILTENVKLGKKMNSLGSHPSVNQEKKKKERKKKKRNYIIVCFCGKIRKFHVVIVQ